MRWRGVCSSAALIFACQTDTAGLEKREPGAKPAEGAGGSGLTMGSPTPSRSTPAGLEQAGATQRSGSLSVLHGLVDGGHLYICPRDAETDQPLGAGPEPLSGLEFGEFQRRSLDWDLASRDVEVELFASPAGGDQSCELLRQAGVAIDSPGLDASVDGGLVAAPPPAGPRRAGNLRLARGSLFEGRHYLLVATGCAAPESVSVPEVCGQRDPLSGVRAELVMVEFGSELSQGESAFGLQFLNASRALGPADLSLQLEGASTLSVPFVSGVSFGVLRPLTVASVEAPLAFQLRGRGASSGFAISQSWTDTLEANGPPQFVAGKNYLLTSIGPVPRADGAGVSLPRLVLVPAD